MTIRLSIQVPTRHALRRAARRLARTMPRGLLLLAVAAACTAGIMALRHTTADAYHAPPPAPVATSPLSTANQSAVVTARVRSAVATGTSTTAATATAVRGGHVVGGPSGIVGTGGPSGVLTLGVTPQLPVHTSQAVTGRSLSIGQATVSNGHATARVTSARVPSGTSSSSRLTAALTFSGHTSTNLVVPTKHPFVPATSTNLVVPTKHPFVPATSTNLVVPTKHPFVPTTSTNLVVPTKHPFVPTTSTNLVVPTKHPFVPTTSTNLVVPTKHPFVPNATPTPGQAGVAITNQFPPRCPTRYAGRPASIPAPCAGGTTTAQVHLSCQAGPGSDLPILPSFLQSNQPQGRGPHARDNQPQPFMTPLGAALNSGSCGQSVSSHGPNDQGGGGKQVHQASSGTGGSGSENGGSGSAHQDDQASLDAKAAKIEPENLGLTNRVAKHVLDLVGKGPFKGLLARPFLTQTTQLVRDIMAAGEPIPDPQGTPNALRWDVPGHFRGSAGVWQLVIDTDNNLILHLNFVH